MNFIGQIFYHFELEEYVVITKFDGESLTYHGENFLVGHCGIETIAKFLGPASIDTITSQESQMLIDRLIAHSPHGSKLKNGTDLTQFLITETEND